MKQELVLKDKLPDGWKWSTLGELGDFLRGPFGSSVQKSVCVQKGKNTYKLYEQGNVINNDFLRGEYYLTEEKYKQLKKFEIQPNDILMTCAGTLGKISVVPEDIEKGIINSVLMRIRLNQKLILNNYFIYLFKSPAFQNKVISQSSGAGIKNLFATKELKKFKILLPPLPVQKQIVATLDAQMAQIEIMKKEAENKYNSSQLFYKSYLEKIFGEEADKGTKPLSTGIKFMVSGISRPFQSQDVGIPVLRSNNVTWGEVNFEDLRYWYNPDDRGTSYEDIILKEGDVLVNFVNGSAKELGKTAVFNGYSRDIIITTNFWRVVFDTSIIIPEYFQLFSMTEKYIRQINKKGKFQGPGSFNQTDFKTIEIPIPSTTRQKEIIKIANNIKVTARILIEESSTCLTSTNQLPSSLLNEVFGKYKIPEVK
jgi:type I restriction enzyme S subunit